MARQPYTRRDFLRLTSATVAGALLTACAPAPAPTAAPGAGPTQEAVTAVAVEGPRQGGTLIIGYPQKTSFTDLFAPEFNAGGTDMFLRRFAFSGLIQVSQDYSEYLPDLAEGWEFDGNTCTFHLRQDAKWHDGEPFTAKDVLFTFRLIAHPNVLTRNGRHYVEDYVVGMTEFSAAEAESISGVTAPDDYTIAIEMPRPFREVFLAQMSTLVMVPEHILGQYPEESWKIDEQGNQGLKKTEFAQKQAIGTGPFRITNYVVDQFVEYEAYEDYHRGRPMVDKLIYQSFADRLSMAAAVEAGSCDIGVRMAESEYERFLAMDHIRVVINASLSNIGCLINMYQPYLSDKRVRQALNLALNRERLIENHYYGTTNPAPAPFIYGDSGASPKMQEYYTYNPEKAKQLLQEAGWDPAQKLRILLQDISPQDEPMWALIRDDWAQAGIATEFQIVGAEYTNITSTPPFDFDLLYSSYVWGGSIADARIFFQDRTLGRNPDNEEGLAVLEEALLINDPAELKAAIWKMQEIAADEARHFLTIQNPGIHAINQRVQGWDIRPIYALWTRNDWGLEKLWLDS